MEDEEFQKYLNELKDLERESIRVLKQVIDHKMPPSAYDEIMKQYHDKKKEFFSKIEL